MTYISRAFWSSLRAKPSGTYLYRGYSAASAAIGRHKDGATSANGTRSPSRSRRGSASSGRSVLMEKEGSVLKRTISREPPSAAAAAMKGMGLGEKEIRGAEEAIENVKEGLQGMKEAARRRQEDGLSSGVRKALEEENAPLVSLYQDNLLLCLKKADEMWQGGCS